MFKNVASTPHNQMIPLIPILTNSLCYPRIRKTLKLCETSDQYFLTYATTCLDDWQKL